MFHGGEILAERFRVERRLGTGGMGAVFAAADTTLGRRVAIKVMHASASDPTALERFQREARAAVQLGSHHAARVFDFGRLSTGEPYIVMEYLEGEDLDDYLRRIGRVPAATAAQFILDACDAVSEAHGLGIVHRDLKLGNLFLAKTHAGPIVKVLDFGIAKAAGDDPRLTLQSLALGSPAYMAPEQMKDAQSADRRSDIWALGVCLYELVTAQLPFEASTVAGVCAAVLKDPPGRMAGVPSWVEDIVMRCLEKDAARRFSTAGELATALREAVDASRDLRGTMDGSVPIPRPADEDARLSSLRRYRLLDTPRDADFDLLAELAAVICQTPYAFVTLVDDNRVWYKAQYGVEEAMTESLRDDDYCSWAILEPRLLHIPDLTGDPRSASLSSTKEGGLRMYCGANLKTPDGFPIGTICVADMVPRELTPRQQDLLAKLAGQVMTLMELRARKADLEHAFGELKRLAATIG